MSKSAQLSTAEEAFGAWRSVLQRAPSPRAWTALCRIVRWVMRTPEAVPREVFLEQWVSYARAHLRAWPASTRVCPRDLFKAMLYRGAGWLAPLFDVVAVQSIAELRAIRALEPRMRVLRFTRCVRFDDVPDRWPGQNVEDGLNALLGTLRHGELESLTLANISLGQAGVAMLSASPLAARLQGLRALTLRGVDLEPSMIGPLAQAPWWRGLQVLRMGQGRQLRRMNNLHGVAAGLVRGMDAPEALAFDGCDLDQRDIDALLALPQLGDLRVLNLRGVPVPGGRELVRSLTSATHLTSLEALHLGYASHFEDTLAAFVASPAARNLHTLSLGMIGEAELRALATLPLRRLIADIRCPESVLASLDDTILWRTLREVSTGVETHPGISVVRALRDPSVFPSLRAIELPPALPWEDALAIAAARPRCRVGRHEHAYQLRALRSGALELRNGYGGEVDRAVQVAAHRAPEVIRLTTSMFYRQFDALCGSPEVWARVHTLESTTGAARAWLEHVRGEHFRALRTIRLTGSGWVDPALIRALARHPALAHVTALIVHHTPQDLAALRA